MRDIVLWPGYIYIRQAVCNWKCIWGVTKINDERKTRQQAETLRAKDKCLETHGAQQNQSRHRA